MNTQARVEEYVSKQRIGKHTIIGVLLRESLEMAVEGD
jgi:hypothetical protein